MKGQWLLWDAPLVMEGWGTKRRAWKHFVLLKASSCNWYTVTFAHIPLIKASNTDRFRDCGVGKYNLTVNLG